MLTFNLEESLIKPGRTCQSEEPIAVTTHNAYTSKQVLKEGTSPDLDVSTAITDGLSNPNDLSNDADIIEVSVVTRYL